MALIIEDGTGTNPAANSYQSTDDLRLYAEARGVDLTSYSNSKLEQSLIKAMDYMEAQRGRYKGEKISVDQPLQWPRTDVWDVEKPGAMLPDNQIPRLVEYAQLSLAIEALEQDLQPNPDITGKGAIMKEKVGDIEITYSAETPKQSFTSAFSKPDALLSPLYEQNGLRLIKV